MRRDRVRSISGCAFQRILRSRRPCSAICRDRIVCPSDESGIGLSRVTRTQLVGTLDIVVLVGKITDQRAAGFSPGSSSLFCPAGKSEMAPGRSSTSPVAETQLREISHVPRCSYCDRVRYQRFADRAAPHRSKPIGHSRDLRRLACDVGTLAALGSLAVFTDGHEVVGCAAAPSRPAEMYALASASSAFARRRVSALLKGDQRAQLQGVAAGHRRKCPCIDRSSICQRRLFTGSSPNRQGTRRFSSLIIRTPISSRVPVGRLCTLTYAAANSRPEP